MKRLILYAIQLLLTAYASAQVERAPIVFTNYTIGNGLPTNNVEYIMEDSRGFIWMGTSQGLAKFDGTKFTLFHHSRLDSNSMPFDEVKNIVELANDELLFCSNNKLWQLNTQNGTQHSPPAFWRKLFILNICVLKNDIIVIRTPGLVYFTNKNLSISDSVSNPIKMHSNVVYLGNQQVLFNNDDKYFCYSLISKRMTEWKMPLLYNGGIQSADTLNMDLLFSNYSNGIVRISYDKNSPLYWKPRQALSIDGRMGGVHGSYYDENAMIIPLDEGLILQEKGKPPVELKNNPINSKSILPKSRWRIFADYQGNYWTTGDCGISRFSLKQINWQRWKLPFNVTNQYYQRLQENIYMCNESYGSGYIDTKSNLLHIIDSNIIRYCWGTVPVNGQVYIHGSSLSYLHPAFETKLMVYNPATNKITDADFLKPFYNNAEIVTLVYQSRNGDIWYSINYGFGLVRQKAGTNEFKQYRYNDKPPPFSFGYVNKAAEDNNGNIYFTSNKQNEVLVWQGKVERFTEWKPDSVFKMSGIHFGPLLCHLVDGLQNLWLLYEKQGLVKYNLRTQTAYMYGSEGGLPSNSFDNMTADAGNNIWFPSEKGLCCYVAANDKFMLFTEQDGLPFSDFQNCYLFFDKVDSSLYFSNLGYVYRTKSYELLKRRKQANVKLFIENISINTKPISFNPHKTIELKPDENNLLFSFTQLDLSNAIRDHKYEYLLISGKSLPHWQPISNTTDIAFYHLNPGQYSLQVRMLNTATGTYINSNVFHFNIATTWYKTVLFRLLIVFLLLAIIFFIVRGYYVRRLQHQKAQLEKEKALEAERHRIAADMHDDIGAGLSRIRYITASMKEKNHANLEDLDRILSLSDESVEKMNEIIWSLNQGNQQLEELIYYTRSQCSEMVSNAGMAFIFDVPENIPAITLGWKECRNIYLLLKESVNNAIKHAGANTITIKTTITDQLQIELSDNGRGFDKEAVKEKGNGLLNYKKRISSLLGTYQLISSPEQGTMLVFSIPLQNTR